MWVMDRNFVPPEASNPKSPRQTYAPQMDQGPWQWQEDWTWQHQRQDRSPRRRKSPRNKGKPGGKNGKKDGKGQGNMKGSDHGGAEWQPSPTWYLPQAPPPPPFVTSSAVKDGPAQSSTHKESDELIKLRQLAKTLQSASSEGLPEDVARALEQVESTTGREDTKNYKHMVTSLGIARRELEATNTAWKAYKTSWMQYGSQMLDLWERHVKAFEEGEQEFVKQRQQAAKKVEEAKSRVREMHEKVTASQAEQMDDLDLEEDTMKVDADPAAVQVKKIKTAMGEALAIMKQNQEEASPRRKGKAEEDERASKPPPQ